MIYLRCHMRVLTAFIIAVLLAPTGVQLSVFTWYEVNKGYLSEVLCENRNMPELHCDGKCVLAQKLKKAEGERSSEPSTPPEVKLNISSYIFNGILAMLPLPALARALEWIEVENRYSHLFVKGLFHPPPPGS